MVYMGSEFSIGKETSKKVIDGSQQGLPDDVFSFVASITPLINVDLLIERDGKILFAWRDDGKNLGWHIPGGIIRYKESIHDRILKTAINEIGTEVTYNNNPLKISEIFMPYQRRGHSISLLYKCNIPDEYEIDNNALKPRHEGFLKWLDHCPDDLVEGQRCYINLIKECFGEINNEDD